MKYYIILKLLFVLSVSYAQNFSKNYYILNDIDSGNKVLLYKSGYLIQFYGQDVSTQNDYYLGIIETDSKGNLIQKTIFDSLMADPVILVDKEKVTLAGSFNHYPLYTQKSYLIQSDPSGIINKQNVRNFKTGLHCTKELEKVDNRYYLTDLINYYGDNFNTHTWVSDSIEVIAFDNSFQYKKSIYCPFIVPILYHASTTTFDNNFFVCALSEQDTIDANMKHLVVAFDSTGKERWKYTSEKNVSPFDKGSIESIGFKDKSTAVLFPYKNDLGIFADQQIIKFDSNGIIKWIYYDTAVAQEGTQEFVSIFKAQNDDIIVIGTQIFVQKNDNRRTGVIMRVNNNGKLKWKRRVWDINTPFGQSGFNGGVELEDGSLLITGWWRDSLGEPNYDTNVWLIKLDSMGCYNPGCTGDDIIASDQNIIVIAKDLLKLNPNPVHNYLQCIWSKAPSNSRFLYLFDINGIEIKKIGITGESGNLEIDTGSLIPGTYFIKLYGDKWESAPEKFVKE